MVLVCLGFGGGLSFPDCGWLPEYGGGLEVDLWVCLLGCVWVRVGFGFRCFGVSSIGVTMVRVVVGLVVILVFLGLQWVGMLRWFAFLRFGV